MRRMPVFFGTVLLMSLAVLGASRLDNPIDTMALQSVARSDDRPSVSLYDMPDLQTSIDLEAIGLPRESVPQMQGKVSYLNSPFLGVQVRFWFETGRHRVLPSAEEEQAGHAG